MNRHFQAKRAKYSYYRNCSMNSNHILHTSKDHKICFMGGLEMRKTNPRWRTAAILKNQKNRNISATV